MAQGKTRLEIARKHLDAWLNAELEVTTRLENIEKRGGRNRIYRAVPRDL